MRCEIPFVSRCCCCFPLRIGLLVWTYLKQVLNVALLILFTWKLSTYTGSISTNVLEKIYATITILVLILDIAFHILFAIGAHTKDYKKIRIFYRYSICFMFLLIVLIFLYLGGIVYIIVSPTFFFVILWYVMMPAVGALVMVLVISAYLTVLVRSEFIKLKNNTQFEFVNRVGEEKCTAIHLENEIIPGDYINVISRNDNEKKERSKEFE